ncbi:RAP domain-containing protein, partial [Haematococcus lacustris]
MISRQTNVPSQLETNVPSRTVRAPAHTLRQYDPPPRPKQDLEQLVSAVKELPFLRSSSQQFDARQLSMAAWSLGKLKPHLPAAAVTSACIALASHSASSEAMKRGSWREWGNLLHGLATAGMQCSSSPDLIRLCDQAVQLLPITLARGAASQDISMTLWAMAKSGYTGSAQPLLQSVTAAISQDVSNILYAMGMLLWHDKEVCRELAEQAVLNQRSMKSQEVANGLYGLARLGYLDSSVRSLAAGVAKADLTAFEPQHLANLLYARSMFLALSIHQAVSSGHSQLASEPQLNSMAAALWRECSRRGQDEELLGEAKVIRMNTIVKLQTVLKSDCSQLGHALAAAGYDEVRASLPEAEAWRQLLQAETGHCAGQ